MKIDTLHNTLLLIRLIAIPNQDTTMTRICEVFECSTATAKRLISSAKLIGAKIIVTTTKAPSVSYLYKLQNWEAIAPNVEKWLGWYSEVRNIETEFNNNPETLLLKKPKTKTILSNKV